MNVNKSYQPKLILLCFLPSNILLLTNTFNYPETSITDDNYDAVLSYLNQTEPVTLQGLQLETCDMQTLLSEVNK